MRHFPFKTLILCVLLPPFVYVFSIQGLERTIQDRYAKTLADVTTGDTQDLFDGSLRLGDAVRQNVMALMADSRLQKWGVRITISVKTNEGDYLYPHVYNEDNTALSNADSIAIARENFRLLSDGLIKTVEVKIDHNTLFSNVILTACVLIALAVFSVFYRRGMRSVRMAVRAKQEVIDSLSQDREASESKLKQLEVQRLRLSEKVDAMKGELDREREKATTAEDDMIEELVALEEKISDSLVEQEQKNAEIDALKEKLREFEKAQAIKSRQRGKEADGIKKRFTALYKNITIHDRAVEGFSELTEEMRIKAEEVIHQLNDNPGKVSIKRKVFGKKNRETVFEVIFAYRGRLYFRNTEGSRVEVLVVGTKLTQNKDLNFLDKL